MPAASHDFAPSCDLEYVYQSTLRVVGGQQNPRIIDPRAAARGLLFGLVPFPKRNPFPIADRKSGVLDGDEEGAARRGLYGGWRPPSVEPVWTRENRRSEPKKQAGTGRADALAGISRRGQNDSHSLEPPNLTINIDRKPRATNRASNG